MKSITTQLGTHYLQSFGIIDANNYCNQPKNVDFTAKWKKANHDV